MRGGEAVVRGGEAVVRGGEAVVRGGEAVVRGGEALGWRACQQGRAGPRADVADRRSSPLCARHLLCQGGCRSSAYARRSPCPAPFARRAARLWLLVAESAATPPPRWLAPALAEQVPRLLVPLRGAKVVAAHGVSAAEKRAMALVKLSASCASRRAKARSCRSSVAVAGSSSAPRAAATGVSAFLCHLIEAFRVDTEGARRGLGRAAFTGQGQGLGPEGGLLAPTCNRGELSFRTKKR